MCYHDMIFIIFGLGKKLGLSVSYKRSVEVSHRVGRHVSPLAATRHGEDGSAQVTVMLSRSRCSWAMSGSPVTRPSSPVILSTISRLLSRSDLEQDQATIIRCQLVSPPPRSCSGWPGLVSTWLHPDPGVNIKIGIRWSHSFGPRYC